MRLHRCVFYPQEQVTAPAQPTALDEVDATVTMTTAYYCRTCLRVVRVEDPDEIPSAAIDVWHWVAEQVRRLEHVGVTIADAYVVIRRVLRRKDKDDGYGF